MAETQHIDVHHHCVPDFYRAEARRAGVTLSGGALLPEWTVHGTLTMLDDNAISAALLSFAPPGVFLSDQKQAAKLASRCNDYLATLIKENPNRLGAFGVLPLPDVNATLAEIDRIFDVLKLDGVGLFSNFAGIYLGDPFFEPVFAELHRRRAIAYLHPAEPPVNPAPLLNLPPWYGEFVFDTTRALTNLIVQGTLERNQGLSLIVAHAGGTAPFIANRINNVWWEMDGAQERAPLGALGYLRRLYYDTASCGAGHGLRLVRDLAGADRILIGSDYPFAPARTVATLTQRLADPVFLGVGANQLRDNALRLFPRFRLSAVTGPSECCSHVAKCATTSAV